jgi:Tol biopolymer transport system component
MQRRYNLALATVVLLGLTVLMIGVDAQAQIAFVSNRSGNWDIYVMDADGGNPRNLTKNRHNDWHPSWSPDGKRIAFASNRDGNLEIYVMDADGGNPRNLTILET